MNFLPSLANVVDMKTSVKKDPMTDVFHTRLTKRPCRVERVFSRKNADGSITVINVYNDEYFLTLDRLAAEFWNQIDGKRTLKGILQKMVIEHDPPVARFCRDVDKLIRRLMDEKLIKLS